MKKSLLLFVITVMSIGVLAQAPQKFNYQAVARDNTGKVLDDKALIVRIGILQDAVLVWQEDHNVNTNTQGLFTLQIGDPLAENASGSAGTFADIEWGSGLYEINVQLDDGGGFEDMGTNELLSVPYSLFSANGPVGPQGPEGPQGPKGDTGPQGETGPQGSEGIQGPPGQTGATGAAGATGATGPMGPQGPKGDAGTGLVNQGDWATGTTYNPGDYVFDRSTDDPGIKSMWILEGDLYVSNTAPYLDPAHWVEFQAPEGPQGIQGIQGETGAMGPQGPQGLQGIQGIQGLKGDKGDKGDTGDVGATGPIGPQGIQGLKGDKGDVGPTGATGPQGIQGLKGDKGDQGDVGPTGATGPQGLQGATGAAGPAGPKGDVPMHQWSGTELRFENPDASWGSFIDLKGEQGIQGIQGIPGPEASDNQTLSLSGTNLFISNGNSVDLSPIQDGYTDADANPTNELQNLYINGHNLSITGGTGVTLPDNVNDADSDPVNELQALSITGHTITLSKGGNSVVVPDNVNDGDFSPTNEIQDLTYSSGILRITNKANPAAINIGSDIISSSGWSRSGSVVSTAYDVGIGTTSLNNAALAIQGGSQLPEEPLFEVRKNNGEPVFAVYNDGVWVYVEEDAKGPKGGFAVGGYNAAVKGPGQQFFRVTKDSTRVYFDETAKGVKGGFAVGGFNAPTKGTSQLMSLEPENYLIGHSAGINLTGAYNQFMGYETGMASTTAHHNVYMGYQVGKFNTGGYSNVMIGHQAGMNGAGYRNVVIGYKAGLTSDGTGSVYIGDEAGGLASGGWANVFIGQMAGLNNTTGVGTQGARNVFIGREAGSQNTTGGNNTYVGTFAGDNNVLGLENAIIGTEAASIGTGGSYNSYMGSRAAYTNSGNYNVVLGRNAGSAQSNYTILASYDNSVMLGNEAGYSTTTGDNNTYVGYRAGRANQTGSGNVFVGYSAGQNETGSNRLYISNSNTTTPLIWGDFSGSGKIDIHGNASINYSGGPITGYGLLLDTPSGQTEQYALYIMGSAYANGGVWNASDENYKKNIKTVVNSVDKLKQIKGVSFEWDDTKSGDPSLTGKSIGILAQDVKAVFPELVKNDKDGGLAVNYDGLIPVLIEAVKQQDAENTTLKEQVNNQQLVIDELLIRIAALESK